MSDVNTNFFQAMDERIMTVLGHAVAGKATEYATLLETVTGISIALYVLWCGYMVFAGKLQRPIESIIWDLAKMGVMMMFMSNIGGYLTLSVDAIEGLKNGLSGNNSVWIWLDELWLKGQHISAKLMELDTSTYVKTDGMIGSALLWVGIIFALVISGLVFLIAEISILLLTTTAPVFIFCLMFGFLRTMFNNWLQAIFSSILTVMFGSLVLSGGLKYLNHVLTVINKQAIDNNIMVMGAMGSAACLICGVVVFVSSKIAHQLAGVGVQGALEGVATTAGATGLFRASRGIKSLLGGGGQQAKGVAQVGRGQPIPPGSGISQTAGRGVSPAKAAVERARAAGWKRVSSTSEQPQSIVPKKGKNLEWK